ncbi:unnamed protein product [Chrysoparadoxa australica]
MEEGLFYLLSFCFLLCGSCSGLRLSPTQVGCAQPAERLQTEYGVADRRKCLRLVAANILVGCSPSWAAGNEVKELKQRYDQRVLTRPMYGIETADVFYPDSFIGTWDTVSTTTDVFPVQNEAAEAKQKMEKGTVLKYKTRFAARQGGPVVADRIYNIENILNASGAMQVVNTELTDPDHLTFFLVPPSGSEGFKASLELLGRHCERGTSPDGEPCFDVMEFVRQTGETEFESNPITKPSLVNFPKPYGYKNKNQHLSSVSRVGGAPVPPLVKDIETITLFVRKDDGTLTAKQVTKVFPPGRDGGNALTGSEYEVVYRKIASAS